MQDAVIRSNLQSRNPTFEVPLRDSRSTGGEPNSKGSLNSLDGRGVFKQLHPVKLNIRKLRSLRDLAPR